MTLGLRMIERGLAGRRLRAASQATAAAERRTRRLLVAALSATAPARTPYSEVRFASMLDRPLILHGELEYLGPGKLGKRVDTPYQEARRSTTAMWRSTGRSVRCATIR